MTDHFTERVGVERQLSRRSLRLSLLRQHSPRQRKEFVPDPRGRVEPAEVGGLVQFLPLLFREPDTENVGSGLFAGLFGSSGHDTIVATKNLGRKCQLALTRSVHPNSVALV